jgi:hypothetical protein
MHYVLAKYNNMRLRSVFMDRVFSHCIMWKKRNVLVFKTSLRFASSNSNTLMIEGSILLTLARICHYKKLHSNTTRDIISYTWICNLKWSALSYIQFVTFSNQPSAIPSVFCAIVKGMWKKEDIQNGFRIQLYQDTWLLPCLWSLYGIFQLYLD